MTIDPEAIAARSPGLGELYRLHVEDYDEFLPHVYMADVTRHVLAAYTGDASEIAEDRVLVTPEEIPGVLAFLAEAWTSGDDKDKDVISLSFLDNLPFPDEPGHAFSEHLPAPLAEEFRRLRTEPPV